MELYREFRKLGKLLEEVTRQYKLVHSLLSASMTSSEPQPGPSRNCRSQNSTSTGERFEHRRQQCPPTPGRNDNTGVHGLLKTYKLRGEKVWVCYCKLEFNSFPKLKAHFVKKTQPKRLVCPKQECRKLFHLGPQLKRHCKEVHKMKVFSCSICYKQFQKENAYKKHMTESLFTDCARKLKEKRRKREPIMSPLREGTYGCPSVRESNEDECGFD